MLIGSGMIAKTFLSYQNSQDIVIFASGVSNSKEQNISMFDREEKLLSQAILEHHDKVFVYFGTCSVYDASVNESDYVKHKKKMENIVQSECKNYYIFRLPQVVGVTTSPTLIHFLFSSIQNNNELQINKFSTRNLLHSDDLYKIVSYLIENKIFLNEITNIASSSNLLVLDIVLKIEKLLNQQAKYELIDFGKSFNIDISKIQSLGMDWSIYEKDYIDKVLKKYYLSMYQSFSTQEDHKLLISIITVVYNSEEFLEKTIQSILSQTYSNIEYIIIDGGSTDGTIDIIKKYEDKISSWVSEQDQGLYDAMNKGAKVANGDFINFINAGDILLTEHVLEDTIEHMNSLDDMYYTRASIVSDTVSWVYPPYDVKDYNKWLKLNLPNHQTIFFPRKFYTTFFYDLRLRIGADDDYKLFALENCNVQFIDILLVEFVRDGLSSNHKSFSLFIQRLKESYIRNFKHKRYIRFFIDPFKLLLMFLIYALFGETAFLRFIKFIVRLKG